jgi:hypothetical protein
MGHYSNSIKPIFNVKAFNGYGSRIATGPYNSYNGEYFHSIRTLNNCVISTTSDYGDSLVNQYVYANTTIFGNFNSVNIISGTAIINFSAASELNDLVSTYRSTGVSLGFYEEGIECLNQKISNLL